MTDRIVLQGVSARGFHGVLASEKRDGQTFVVDVVMEVDLAPAGASDDLNDTVNYAEVAGDIVALIEGESLDLIEALAARIADRVLARPLVEAVEVTVHKPQAPVGHPFTDVQVKVTRERQTPVVIAHGLQPRRVPRDPARRGRSASMPGSTSWTSLPSSRRTPSAVRTSRHTSTPW